MPRVGWTSSPRGIRRSVSVTKPPCDGVLARLLGRARWLGAGKGDYFQVVPFQCKSAVLGLEVE